MTVGFFTVQELIALKLFADKANLDSKTINFIIQSDLVSPLKHRMSQGALYYRAEHDILLNKKHYYIDGEKQVDKVASNERVPMPFFKIIADQKTAYITGNPIVIGVSAPDVNDEKNPTPAEQAAIDKAEQFEEDVSNLIGNRFDDVVSDWVTGSSKKAVEWVHFYIDKDGMLRYMIVPAEQVIAVYDTQYQDRLQYVIRFYVIDMITDDGQKASRYNVEWWSDTDVEYWTQDQTGLYVHDPDYEYNPAPHWFVWNTLSPADKQKNSWGKIPFIPLYNNSEWRTDLDPIKPLIDAYDKAASGWVNDLEDFQEQILVLKGFVGIPAEVSKGVSELALFMHNLKNNRVIAVEENGDVKNLKAEIPVEAKNKLLELLRDAIFFFGEAVDVSGKGFRSDPSGVSLKFLYASLDLKANRTIRKLKTALTEFFWFICFYLNMKDKSANYDPSDVLFTINKTVIFNEKEKIDGLVASAPFISRQTLLEQHPYVEDVNEEIQRLDSEEADKQAKQAAQAAAAAKAMQDAGVKIGKDGKPIPVGQPIEPPEKDKPGKEPVGDGQPTP